MGIIKSIFAFFLSLFGKKNEGTPAPTDPPVNPIAPPELFETVPPIEVLDLFTGDIKNPIQFGQINTFPRQHVNYLIRQNRIGLFVVGVFVDGAFVSQKSVTRMDERENGETFPGYFAYPNAPVAVHKPGTHIVQFKVARHGGNFKTGNTGEILYVSPEFPVNVVESL